MISSSSLGSASFMDSALGNREKSAGVTLFTRSSVHCAERIVATRSWKGSSCRSAHAASGCASLRRAISRPMSTSVDSLVSRVEMPHTLDPLLGLRRVAEYFEDGKVPRLEAVHLEKLLFHVRLDVQVHRHRVENGFRAHVLAERFGQEKRGLLAFVDLAKEPDQVDGFLGHVVSPRPGIVVLNGLDANEAVGLQTNVLLDANLGLALECDVVTAVRQLRVLDDSPDAADGVHFRRAVVVRFPPGPEERGADRLVARDRFRGEGAVPGLVDVERQERLREKDNIGQRKKG